MINKTKHKQKLDEKGIEKFLKKTSRRYFGTDIYWRALGEKFKKQKGLCYYTNIKISLGEQATIDHFICLNSGGKNTLENMYWCHRSINYMKNKMTPEEFKNLLIELRTNLPISSFLLLQ